MSLSINRFFETKAVNSLLKRVITKNPSPFFFPLEGEENVYEPAFVHGHACEAHVFHYVAEMEQSVKEGKKLLEFNL